MTDSMRTKGGYYIRPLELHSQYRHSAKVYRFVFKDCGWVIFTICDDTGELSVQSDWGCWGHRWSTDPKHIGHPTITDFLRDRASAHYVTNKLSYSMPADSRDIPCETATGDSMRRRVIEARRKGEIDRDEARELWDDIQDTMNAYADGGHGHAYHSMSQKLCDILGEPWEYFETEEAPSLVILRERLLPFLFAELKREQQESKASA